MPLSVLLAEGTAALCFSCVVWKLSNTCVAVVVISVQLKTYTRLL